MAAPLHIGFVLVPDFTMLALAGFIDTLRLAADEGDRSRPIDCRWTLMTEDGRPVRASNGVQIEPDSGLKDPADFDYVVVAGGTLHRGIRAGDQLQTWLRRAAGAVPLVGICTGSFVLARCGLLEDRLTCVSWFHRREFEAEFPGHEVCSDRLFVSDRERITCAGGTSVVHLASSLIELHLGEGRAQKGLRVMIEGGKRGGTAPQPLPGLADLDRSSDSRVRRAILLMERQLGGDLMLTALADEIGMSARHLRRLFRAELGMSFCEIRGHLRNARAKALLRQPGRSTTTVALASGFADASHLAREFRRLNRRTPSQFRADPT